MTEVNYGLDVVKIRLVKEPTLQPKRKIASTTDAIAIISEELSDYDREVFCVLNLRSDGSVINLNIVSIGTLNSSLVSPREVFKSSILTNAAAICAIHSHPSGSIWPSEEDHRITERLVACGELMDIKVIDHIIVGPGCEDYYSFAAHDELDRSTAEKRFRETIHER